MKRPAWAAAPGFSACWASAEYMSKLPMEGLREGGENTLIALARAMPIAIPAEQVDVLPRLRWKKGEREGIDHERLGAVFHDVRLPFDPTFLDLGGVHCGGGKLLGALVLDSSHIPSSDPGITVFPFLQGHEDPVHRSLPWIGYSGTEDSTVREFDLGLSLIEGGEEMRERERASALLGVDLALSALQWLEAFHSEVVEAPLSPRQRERELKKGRQIALTVQIKQSKQYASRSTNTGKIDYSHRFGVRGHWKHHFETKPDGSPNKVFARCYAKDSSRLTKVDGKPCFRFFTQPFVKGPNDRPFIPKARLAEGH